ncbi:hypothetical protein VULLAG_LOCUS15445 [Vulpes lagopus]
MIVTEREKERGRDIGRGRSRLHAPGARRGTRSQVSRIAPWAKGRHQTAAPPRDPPSVPSYWRSFLKLNAVCYFPAQNPAMAPCVIQHKSQDLYSGSQGPNVPWPQHLGPCPSPSAPAIPASLLFFRYRDVVVVGAPCYSLHPEPSFLDSPN